MTTSQQRTYRAILGYFAGPSESSRSPLQILKEAVESAGAAHRLKVVEAIRRMNLKEGPATAFFPGPIRFDEKGRRVDVPLIFQQWQKGAPLTVYPTDHPLAKPY